MMRHRHTAALRRGPGLRRSGTGAVLLAATAVLCGYAEASRTAGPDEEGSRSAETPQETIEPMTETISLDEFDTSGSDTWQSIDDVVMGGVSGSRMSLSESGTGLFEGELSLANNGGFASVRRSVGPLDLSAHEGLALRVRGDGQRYRLRLRTDQRFDGVAWQADFPTTAGEWTRVVLPFPDFEPSYRGRRPPDAGPLDTASICQVGLMIADRQSGPFRLEIDWIRTQDEGR